MGTLKKTFFVCVLVTVALFVSLISVGLLTVPNLPSLDSAERVVIRHVSLDSADQSTLLIDAQSTSSSTITFSTAIVRNSKNDAIVAVCPIQTELPAYKDVIVTVALTNILNSGNYTVALETTRGNNFASPMFAVQ